jgi:hypothetical protein
LSLQEFNSRLSETRSPLEFISASLSGYLSSGEALTVGLTTPSPTRYETYYDIDSIGMYTIDIPSTGPFNLHVNPFAYNSIKTKAHFGIAVEDKILDIHRLPNVAIGEFGELGRFTVSQYNTTGR